MDGNASPAQPSSEKPRNHDERRSDIIYPEAYMKSWLKLLLVCFPATVCLILGAVFLQGQEGPNSSSGQTVAKPRKPPTSDSSTAPATDAEQPKIPSAYNKKNAET